MPLLHGGFLSTGRQLLCGILPDRLQQREARLSTCALLRLHQALVQQVCQLLQHRSIVGLRRGRCLESLEDADRLHCFQRETAGEDREAPEQLLFACLQQVVAPGNRVAQRLLALWQVSCPPAGQRQAVLQSCQQGSRGEQRENRRGQLECQWQPVQALADLDDGGRILARQGEIGPGLTRTLDEQSHRRDLHEVLQVRYVCGVRQRERWHRHDLLVTHAQGLAARHEQFEPRGQLERLGCQRSRGNQLLDVVEHEQHLSGPQVLQQPLVHRSAPALGHTKRSGHGRDNERGVFERGQRDERDAVCELRGEIGSHLHRQSCFADTAWPGQRHQTHILPLQQGLGLCALLFAIDEPPARHGQRGQPSRYRGLSRGGETLGQELRQVVGDPLAQLLGRGELLVRSGILRADAVEQRMQALLPLWSGCLDIDQLRFPARELVLVLQAGYLHTGGDPAIALPVEADEDIALRQVGPVQLARWIRACAQLEKHGRQAQLRDGLSCRSPLRGQLVERRADKHPHALVRRADHRRSAGSLYRSAFCIQRMICLHRESSPFQEPHFLFKCRFRKVLLKNHNHEV